MDSNSNLSPMELLQRKISARSGSVKSLQPRDYKAYLAFGAGMAVGGGVVYWYTRRFATDEDEDENEDRLFQRL